MHSAMHHILIEHNNRWQDVEVKDAAVGHER
jgi:hypothetical protein